METYSYQNVLPACPRKSITCTGQSYLLYLYSSRNFCFWTELFNNVMNRVSSSFLNLRTMFYLGPTDSCWNILKSEAIFIIPYLYIFQILEFIFEEIIKTDIGNNILPGRKIWYFLVLSLEFFLKNIDFMYP